MTGKYVSTTKYRDPQTGEETKTTTNRRFARKLATLWEADLNSGRDQGRHATSWQQFRQRYEDEVVPGLASGTAAKIATVLDAVERILPTVAEGRVADLTPERVSRFQAELRDGKRSENTIAGYLAHLRAALQWAADQGIIPAVPKIKRPHRAKKGGRRKSKGRPITAEEFDRLLEKVPAALLDWRRRKRDIDVETRRRNPPLGYRNYRLLSPGMFVRIRLPIGEPHEAILVPQEAVGTDQGKKYLKVVNDKDIVEYRPITLGAQQPDGLQVVIPVKMVSTKDGLQPTDEAIGADEKTIASIKLGERIIVGGLQFVHAGMHVQPESIRSSNNH